MNLIVGFYGLNTGLRSSSIKLITNVSIDIDDEEDYKIDHYRIYLIKNTWINDKASIDYSYWNREKIDLEFFDKLYQLQLVREKCKFHLKMNKL